MNKKKKKHRKVFELFFQIKRLNDDDDQDYYLLYSTNKLKSIKNLSYTQTHDIYTIYLLANNNIKKKQQNENIYKTNKNKITKEN